MTHLDDFTEEVCKNFTLQEWFRDYEDDGGDGHSGTAW